MTKKLALLCDVQRLYSHENTTDRALVVGLSLQLTFTEGLDSSSEQDVNWARLWHWQPIVECDVWFFGAAAPHLAGVATWQLPAAPAPAGSLEALDRRLDALWTDVKQAAFQWDPGNPQTPPPQDGHVLQVQAAAARVAASVGYGLNLSAVLKLAQAQVPFPGNQLPAGAQVLVVPRLRFKRDAGLEVKYEPADDALTAPAVGESVAWKYTPTMITGNVADVPELTAIVAPFDTESNDSNNRFIQLSTGWVRTALEGTAGPPDQSDDWTLKLLRRVAEHWDVARHLQDAVSGYVAIPNFPLFWQMIIAAFRDRASLGLIDTTDGNGLLRFAIQQALPLQNGGNLPTTRQVVIRDGQLRSLQAILRVNEQAGTKIAGKSIEEWWTAVRAALSPELQANLGSTPQVPQPSRPLRIRWPVGDPVIEQYFPPMGPAGPPAGSATTLRVYTNRSDSRAARIAEMPALVGQFQVKTPDLGMETVFDAYAQGQPLPAGWYEVTLALVAVGMAPPLEFSSPRQWVGPALANDLGPLIRVWTELQSAPALARLIGPCWDQVSDLRFGVPKQVVSRPWYTTVWTKVQEDTPIYTISYSEIGEIKPADGRTWVVTLANITHHADLDSAAVWIDNAEYALELASVYLPDGTTEGTTAMVRVKLSTTAGQKQLEVKLTQHATTGDHELDAKTFNAAGDAYHLRVELKVARDGKLRLSAFVGETSGPSAVTWTASVSSPSLDRGLDRCGLRVVNNMGGADHFISAGSPSLLAAPDSLDSLPELRDAWYANLQPAQALWGEGRSQILEILPRLDLSGRLALGQTARLVTVWNKQIPAADTDYEGYLNRKFSELLSAMVDQRFDRTAKAKVNSIYRDFLPEVSATSLSPALARIVADHLSAVASRVRLIPKPKKPGFVEQESDRYCTPTPHPLNVQVDRPAMFSDTIAQNGDEDLLRQLSGFGVLMQQADRASAASADANEYFKDQPWRILNCVDVATRNTNLPDPRKPLYSFFNTPAGYQRMIAVLPLQYQDQIRQVTIPYQNQHLGALSPLADIADAFDFGNQHDGQPDLQNNLPPFMRKIPSAAAGGAHDWGLLPTLKFGQFYRMMVFVSGNCGNLPALLTGGPNNHPAALRNTTVTTAQFDAESTRLGTVAHPKYFESVVHETIYLRRVGISAPRLERADWPNVATMAPPGALLPEVPPDVRPLSREWGIVGLTATKPYLRWSYDDLRRQGEIVNTANWLLIVPRVMIAGGSDDDANGAIQFTLSVGLRSTDGATAHSCGVKLERQGSKLIVNGGAEVEIVHPDVGPLSSGPLDFRLAYANTNLYLSWRRADRDELWLPWHSNGELVSSVTVIPGNAWIEIKRDVPTVRESIVTFGTPEFSTGTVAISSETPPRVINDQLGTLSVAASSAPIVVVHPGDQHGRSEFTFRLRPPATDLETWDAWTQMDRGAGQAELDKRKAIWSRHKYLSSNTDKSSDRMRFDGSLDDPAVDKLLVELVPLRTDSPQKVIREIWKPADNTVGIDPLAGSPHLNPLNSAQRLPAKFVVKAITLWEAAPAARLQKISAAAFQVTVQEQEIWQLRIYPLVSADYCGNPATPKPGLQRFHSDFSDQDNIEDGGKYRVFVPWTLTIEVSTKEVVQLVSQQEELAHRQLVLASPPEQQRSLLAATRDVRQGLLLSTLAPRFDGKFVQVSLVKPSPRVFRYADRIRLLRQVWRWRGRPVPPFPLETLAAGGLDQFPPPSNGHTHSTELEAPNLPMLWDAVGFGDRSAVDLLEETRPIASDQARASLFREDLSGDRRALYYRFTNHALGRYAGLYRDASPIVMASESPPLPTVAGAGAGNNSARNAWRRLLVPCRREQSPPRPAVRFVVPLTESEEDAAIGRVPGLLVVLDDPWFAVGGLADTLQTEVVNANDYWETRVPSGDKNPIVRPEFGPDPAETEKGWTRGALGETENPTGVPHESLAMDLVGPIGHTFDTDADAPLYNASSFILRPPGVRGVTRPNSDDRGLDWYFAKVRFRRMLLPEMFPDYQVGEPIAAATLPSPTDLKLNDDQAWIIDVANIKLTAGLAVRFAVKLTDSPPSTSGTNLGGRGTVEFPQDERALSIKWTPQNPAASTASVEIARSSSDGEHWTHARIDIRFVLQRDGEAGLNNGQPAPPPRHLMVEYRLDGIWKGDPDEPAGTSRQLETKVSQRIWRTLATQLWDGDGNWPTQIAFEVAGDVTATPSIILPARLSSFSAPYWLQFLPDSQLLLPRFASQEASLLQRPNEFWLAWKPQTVPASPPAWTLLLQTSTDKTNVTRRLAGDPVAAANSDMAFQRRILLTEMLTDVRGQLGHERYCGLYKLEHAGELSATLVEVHASPVIAQQGLRSDTLPPTGTKISRRMRARIVEMQVIRSEDQGAPQLEGDVWSELFPLGDTAKFADVRARIVRVSSPIELQEDLG